MGFLRRGVNKGLVAVMGETVNRGAGYGLEISCTYHLHGSKSFIDKLKVLVDAICSNGHL